MTEEELEMAAAVMEGDDNYWGQKLVAEVRRLRGARICGMVAPSAGPNGEPVACAWAPDHLPESPHSWAWVQTFTPSRSYTPRSPNRNHQFVASSLSPDDVWCSACGQRQPVHGTTCPAAVDP